MVQKEARLQTRDDCKESTNLEFGAQNRNGRISQVSTISALRVLGKSLEPPAQLWGLRCIGAYLTHILGYRVGSASRTGVLWYKGRYSKLKKMILATALCPSGTWVVQGPWRPGAQCNCFGLGLAPLGRDCITLTVSKAAVAVLIVFQAQLKVLI